MKSLRKAIDAKCKDCIYDELDKGNWKQQVTACQARTCPLWAVRPLTRPSTPEKKARDRARRQKAIALTKESEL